MRPVIRQRALRRRHAALGRVDRDRRAQRAGEGLERRLDHVVGVRAGLDLEVQRQARVAGDGAEELLEQLVLEAAGLARRGRPPSSSATNAPAGDVDRAHRARLVHRHDRVAVAVDPAAVAERRVERLAEDDPDVLDGVVRAGLQVARGLRP